LTFIAEEFQPELELMYDTLKTGCALPVGIYFKYVSVVRK